MSYFYNPANLLDYLAIAHFTVAGENEAGIDLVLIQPFLLYYVNHVFLMLTSIFKAKFTLEKNRGFYQKTVNWPINEWG